MSTDIMQFTSIIEQYETEVDELPEIYAEIGGGSRGFSGRIFENLIKRTCDHLGLVAKKNDYLGYDKPDMKLKDYPIYPLPLAFKNGTVKDPDNLQVDWHVYKQGLLKFFIESKCYLDSDYLLRTVENMIQIHNSPDNKNPSDKEYCIIAGQNACSPKKLKLYIDKFYNETGKRLNIFFLNPQKTRNSLKAIYMAEYREDFRLDKVVYNEIIKWLEQ